MPFDTKGTNGTSLSFSLKKKSSGQWYSALGGGSFELSPDFCYALHITGPAPELRRLAPPSVGSCVTAPPGLGKVVGLFSKGDTAEIDIPIGLNRRFDLFAYPKAVMPDGACAHTLRVDPPAAGSSTQMQFFIDGQTFSGKAQLIATATTEIKEGVNNITLVAAGDSPIGVPYGCNGSPTLTVAQPTEGAIMSFRTAGNYGAGGLCSEVNQQIKISVGDLEFETTCAANQTWSKTFSLSSLPDGAYVLKAQHRDVAGNWSATDEVGFTKDSSLNFVPNTTIPSLGSAGAPLFSSLTLTVTDANGPITEVSGLMGLTAYTNVACSTLAPAALKSGANGLTPSTLASGAATFTNVNYPSAISKIYLRANVGDVSSKCMGPIQIDAAGAHHFTITGGLPSSPYVASSNYADIVVEYRDYFNNAEAVTGTPVVGFYAYRGVNCPAGTGLMLASQAFTSGNSSVTIPNVQFTDAQVQSIGVSFYDAAAPDSNAGYCQSFQVTADSGAASGSLKFGVILPAASVNAGTNNVTLKAELQDSFGNPVAATTNPSAAVSAYYNDASCSSGTLIDTQSIANGSTQTPNIVASLQTAGQYWFKANLTSGVASSACTGPISVAGTPDTIAFKTVPSTATATSSFTVDVKVVDTSGNQIGSSGDTVTLSAHSAGDCTDAPSAYFKKASGSGAVSSTTSNGVMSLAVQQKLAGNYYIKASATINSVLKEICSSQVVVSPGPAVKMVALLPGEVLNSGNPASAKTAAPPSPSSHPSLQEFPIDLYITDANHNVVTTANSGTVSMRCQDPHAHEAWSGTASGIWGSGHKALNILPRDVGSWTCTATATVASLVNVTATTVPITVVNACSQADDTGIPFHMGDGSTATPYVICNQSELAVGSLDRSKNFVIGADIALTGTLSPIGGGGSVSGKWYGEGHTISNLAIGTSGSNLGAQALFGSFTGMLYDLNVVVEAIYGGANVAAVAGYNSGTLSRVKVRIPSGKFVLGSDNVGGIAGSNSGSILDSTVLPNPGGQRGLVIGTASNVGGIAGSSTGTIRRVAAGVDVQCQSSSATACSATAQAYGGIVGLGNAGVGIQQAAFYGNIYGATYTGGLVGYLNMSTSPSYVRASYAHLVNLGVSTNSVSYNSGTGYVGGLFGKVTSGTLSLKELYSQGDTAIASTGGTIAKGSLAGYLGAPFDCGSSTPCFGHSTLTGDTTLAGAGSSFSNAASKTYAELQTAATFTGWGFTATNDHDSYPTTSVWMRDTTGVPVFQWMQWTGLSVNPAHYGVYSANAPTLSEGALRLTQASCGTTCFLSAAGDRPIPTTGGTNKWYWEVTLHPSASGSNFVDVGLATTSQLLYQGLGFGTGAGFGFLSDGRKMNYPLYNSPQAYGDSFAPGDTVGIMYDGSGATKYIGLVVNGEAQGPAFAVAAGSYYPVVGAYGGGGYDVSVNFGTKPFSIALPAGYQPVNYQP